MLQDNSRRYMTFAAPTIIGCKYYYISLLWRRTVEISMAASLKDKGTPITTSPYQVPSVDVTPDPPIFSLVTTFNVDKTVSSSEYIYNSAFPVTPKNTKNTNGLKIVKGTNSIPAWIHPI